MSELTRMILLFVVMLVCFVGAFFVLPAESAKVMIGAIGAITLYSILQKILQLWRER